jgi:uncharacterized membrane protein YfbV (UPF0208 family)
MNVQKDSRESQIHLKRSPADAELPVRIVEDSVTALATYAITLVPAWML